jgi:prolyl 4-hydroxylase
LTSDEAERVIRLAIPKMKNSKVYGVAPDAISNYRTSCSAHLLVDDNSLVAAIYDRVAAYFGCPVTHVEALQVLRYEPSQFFVEHYDFISENLEHFREGGQRLRSLLVYLNDLPTDEPGGSTLFPRLHLSVRCAPGSGLCWDNVDAAGNLEVKSLHAGTATVSSTKFALICFQRSRTIPAHARPALHGEPISAERTGHRSSHRRKLRAKAA